MQGSMGRDLGGGAEGAPAPHGPPQHDTRHHEDQPQREHDDQRPAHGGTVELSPPRRTSYPPAVTDLLAPLGALPGVEDGVAQARAAVDGLLAHRVLRRRSAEVTAESALPGGPGLRRARRRRHRAGAAARAAPRRRHRHPAQQGRTRGPARGGRRTPARRPRLGARRLAALPAPGAGPAARPRCGCARVRPGCTRPAAGGGGGVRGPGRDRAGAGPARGLGPAGRPGPGARDRQHGAGRGRRRRRARRADGVAGLRDGGRTGGARCCPARARRPGA